MDSSLAEQVARRDRQLDTLAAVAARIQSAEDETAILEVALEEILRNLGLKAAWVFLGEEDSDELRLAAANGVSESYLRKTREEGLGTCLCLEVFASGATAQARNTTECPRMPQLIDGLRAQAPHACIPLRLRGRSRGVLNVAAPAERVFADDELRFLETLGRQICLALERARHREEERRTSQQAQAMVAINKAIGGALDSAAVLEAVADAAARLLGSDHVYVFLGTDPRAVAVGYTSGTAQLRVGQTVDLEAMGWPLACRALTHRETIQVDDVRDDPRVNRAEAARLGIGSVLIEPLVARDRVEGVIAIGRMAASPWIPEQLDLAGALAAQAAVALENARLYEDARQAYQELRDAQARIILSEKMAVLGTFASGLAHEVRNPLNSIALQLSLLERRTARMAPDAAAQTAQLVRVIREEVQRLDSLVGDFLQFARTTRVPFTLADVRVIADEVVRLMEPEAEAAGVVLGRRSAKQAPPQVPLVAERIKQVLINLVRNAIEALGPGGRVEIADEPERGGAALRVKDDGPGLPDGLDVFQLFVTTKAQGTGLGLPIAQQIVDEHDGEITVESQPGRGTAFSVWLPGPDPERSGARGAEED